MTQGRVPGLYWLGGKLSERFLGWSFKSDGPYPQVGEFKGREIRVVCDWVCLNWQNWVGKDTDEPVGMK